MGARGLKFVLAAFALYFGSLLVLRYSLADILLGSRHDLWVAYAALIVGGMLLAEILHLFRNPVPAFLRMPLLATLVVAGLFAFQYSPLMLRQADRQQPVAAVAVGSAETVLYSGWDGHFRSGAMLNGVEIGLLVDTGATLVLLRYEDALAARIDFDSLVFGTPVATAGSRAYVAPILLPVISIGDVTLRDVRAAVAGPGMLHTSLLGMSFLENLSETVIRGDQMILRQ